MKHFVEWKSLALILSEISDDMYSSSYEYEKRFAQNGAGSIPIWMLIACFISNIKIAVLS